MSKKKRRNKKQNRRNLVAALIVALIVILSIILVVAFKGEGKTGEVETLPSDNTKATVTNVTMPYEEPVIVSKPEETETTTTQTTETTTQATTAPKPSKAPTGKYSSTIDKVVSHYASFMSTPENALYIRDSEVTESGDVVKFILRMNGKSPNMLVCDVYVNTTTGEVTDSMENEPWNLND